MRGSMRRGNRRILDDRFKSMPTSFDFQVPQNGWIRSIRESIGMSAADLGARLGVAPQSVLTLERSEVAGRARMDSLKKAAEAMDCSFVYALVPNSSLEEFVQEQTQKVITETMKKVSHSMKLEGQTTELSDSHYNELLLELQDSSKIWRILPLKK